VASRRDLMLAAVALLSGCAVSRDAAVDQRGAAALYGRFGKIKAKPGMREALIAALVDGSHDMPGNLAYIVGKDQADADGVWITEVWRDANSHRASLELPQVRRAISVGREMIAGFDTGGEGEVVGAAGLR